jgi:hypothetical protein
MVLDVFNAPLPEGAKPSFAGPKKPRAAVYCVLIATDVSPRSAPPASVKRTKAGLMAGRSGTTAPLPTTKMKVGVPSAAIADEVRGRSGEASAARRIGLAQRQRHRNVGGAGIGTDGDLRAGARLIVATAKSPVPIFCGMST